MTRSTEALPEATRAEGQPLFFGVFFSFTQKAARRQSALRRATWRRRAVAASVWSTWVRPPFALSSSSWPVPRSSSARLGWVLQTCRPRRRHRRRLSAAHPRTRRRQITTASEGRGRARAIARAPPSGVGRPRRGPETPGGCHNCAATWPPTTTRRRPRQRGAWVRTHDRSGDAARASRSDAWPPSCSKSAPAAVGTGCGACRRHRRRVVEARHRHPQRLGKGHGPRQRGPRLSRRHRPAARPSSARPSSRRIKEKERGFFLSRLRVCSRPRLARFFFATHTHAAFSPLFSPLFFP